SRLLSEVAWPSASGKVNSGARAPIASIGPSRVARNPQHHSWGAGCLGKARREEPGRDPLRRSRAGPARRARRVLAAGRGGRRRDWTCRTWVLESRALRGAVAQLGERRVRNAKVEGSIPFRSTIFHLF